LRNSAQVGASFNDESGKSMTIDPVFTSRLWIPQTIDNSALVFNSVNVTTSASTVSNQLTTFTMSLFDPRVALNIHVRPLNLSNAYLVCIKYSDVPVMSENTQSYDLFRIFCPSDLTSSLGDTYYAYFVAGSYNTNNLTKAYYGIRDLSLNETIMYCENTTFKVNLTSAPLLVSTQTQTQNSSEVATLSYDLRVFVTCCKYFDSETTEWYWDGVNVLSDSNLTHIHCETNHFTDFAGGFIVLPPKMDFGYIFSHADFAQNLTIYLTIIIVSSLYMILFVWCTYADRKDKSKTNVYLMEDNNANDLYFYELIVITGTRKGAGTESNVFFSQ
jgi:hypothetical protein